MHRPPLPRGARAGGFGSFPARDYTRRRHPFRLACAKRHPPGRGKSGGGGEVPPANGMMTCKVGRTVGTTRRQGAAGRQRRREYSWRKRRSRVFRVVRSWAWAAPRSRARRLPGWRGAPRKAAAMRPRRRRGAHRAARRAACPWPKAAPRLAPTWPACTAGRSRPKPSQQTRSRTPRTATCSSSAPAWAVAAPPIAALEEGAKKVITIDKNPETVVARGVHIAGFHTKVQQGLVDQGLLQEPELQRRRAPLDQLGAGSREGAAAVGVRA